MNGVNKFHKATGPAFLPGEVWRSHAGNLKVTIVSVRAYIAKPTHISDYGVTYEWMERGNTVQHEKDAWNFQVRYHHVADENLRVTKQQQFQKSIDS